MGCIGREGEAVSVSLKDGDTQPRDISIIEINIMKTLGKTLMTVTFYKKI